MEQVVFKEITGVNGRVRKVSIYEIGVVTDLVPYEEMMIVAVYGLLAMRGLRILLSLLVLSVVLGLS